MKAIQNPDPETMEKEFKRLTEKGQKIGYAIEKLAEILSEMIGHEREGDPKMGGLSYGIEELGEHLTHVCGRAELMLIHEQFEENFDDVE